MKQVLALLLALMLSLSAFALAEEPAQTAETEAAPETAAEETAAEEAPAEEVPAEEPVEETLPAVTPGSLVGVWYGYASYLSDREYRCVGDVRVEFNRDKTGLLVLNESSYAFTWSVDDDKTKVRMPLDDTEAMEFKPYGYLDAQGRLVVDAIQDGTTGSGGRLKYLLTYVFTKENNILVPPSEKAAEAEDEFYGEYKALYAVEANKAMYYTEDETISLRVDFAEAEIVRPNSSSNIFVTEFKDGKVVVTLEGNQGRVLNLSSEYNILNLSLTEDPEILKFTACDADTNVGGVAYLQKVQ